MFADYAAGVPIRALHDNFNDAGPRASRGSMKALSVGLQLFFAVKPEELLVIYPPAFPRQECMQLPIAIAHPEARQVAQPQPQGEVRMLHAPVPRHGPGKHQGVAGPPL
jgi:hypothetical protein